MKLKKFISLTIFSAIFSIGSIVGSASAADENPLTDEKPLICNITYTNPMNNKKGTFTRIISNDAEYQSCLNQQNHAQVEIKKL